MTPRQLFEAGRVKEAEAALAAVLRDNPSDAASRTFLFELLCFSGQYDRAGKQLGVLASGSRDAELGAVLYYSALHAEKTRHEMFQKEAFPTSVPDPPRQGALNGKPFRSIADIDPVIGSRLEVYAAGAYLWVPFVHIQAIHIESPRRLRDTLWLPASVIAASTFKGADLGEVLIPVVYPYSWNSDDQEIWLGRKTEWVADDSGREFPVGQKMFRVDDEDVPLLSIRSIEFASHAVA